MVISRCPSIFAFNLAQNDLPGRGPPLLGKYVDRTSLELLEENGLRGIEARMTFLRLGVFVGAGEKVDRRERGELWNGRGTKPVDCRNAGTR